VERKLDGLAPGIRDDAGAWLRTLRDGGPRSRPRDPATVIGHMNYARPALLAWSSQYGHLREVTRDDVLAVLGELHGDRRSSTLVALRSLFAFCKRRKSVFRSPVQGIRVGERVQGVIQSLSQDEVDQAAEAATTPAARLVLVLAAMHAARFKAIRQVRLDDVDLGNRQITIGGRARPLDDLTRQVLLEWLAHRAARWPSTANPHLMVNQHSANGTEPVSTSYFAKTALKGKAATLERLRVDRHLQEALAVGPDPLHLASVFGNRQTAQKRHADLTRRRSRPPSVDRPAPKIPDTRQDDDIPGAKTLVNAGALPKSTTRSPRRPANASDHAQMPAAPGPQAPRKRPAAPKITDAIIAEGRYQLVRAPDHAETRAWHVLVGGRPARLVRPTWRGEISRPGWEPVDLSGLALPVKGTGRTRSEIR
jgi:hypothetical protein